jgi:hypothetical protein
MLFSSDRKEKVMNRRIGQLLVTLKNLPLNAEEKK